MDRFWLKSYPPGVPADVDCTRYRSLAQLLEEAFATYGARPAYRGFGVEMSYAELDRRSAAIAAWLQDAGVGRGARVALMLPNVLAFPVAMCGALRAGCAVVNVNPLYTPRELEHQLRDSGAEVIFILENFASTLQAVRGKTPLRHVVLCSTGDLLGFPKGVVVNFVVRRVRKLVPPYELPGAERFERVLARGLRLPRKPVDIGPDDVAFLQYTGGTTGVSKGATLLHRNLVANVLQSEAWYQPGMKRMKAGEQVTTVVALPLYHVFALTACALLAMRSGGKCILIPNPRDLAGLVKELQGQAFHVFPAVNTLFNALVNFEPFRKLDFSRLLLCVGGGMAVQEAVAQRWLAVTGCPICEGYGLSETSPSAICNSTDTDRYTGTIGLPLPSTEVALLDDGGNPVELGAPGEIAIRGPQVMAGYWQRPDETARVMTADGFLRTGDVGVMDAEGRIRIVDRKKDMILVSGFNVYPNEIENVLMMHPGILECAAVGVSDSHTGEAVKVFVVRRDPELTERAIRDFCAERLTGYKRPRYIEFRPALPKTGVGKVLRRELRDGEHPAR
ncbi:MAG TPA: long-chain-fatty-acid--CoA ligase [Burkholderiaceae bacterium]|nr:long-chain-fatty-acid--CoA ligase [Burkholderiaceae bacterium]